MGGYKGEHVWTELEAMINASNTAFGVTQNTTMYSGGGFSYAAGKPSSADPTLDQAEQDAKQQYASNTPVQTTNLRAFSQWTTNGNGNQWGAQCGSLNGTIADASYNAGAPRTTQVYSWLAGGPAGQTVDASGNCSTGIVFNALGSPLRNGVYTLVGSGSSVTFGTDKPGGFPGDLGYRLGATWGFQVAFDTLLTFTGLHTVG